MRLALALLVVGCSQHHPSDPPEIAKPAVAPKGGNVNNYVQQAAVDSVVLTPAGLVGNIVTSMLAFAPDGKSWASAFAVDVRFFEGLREVRRISQMNSAAGSIGFSPDGKTLRLGNHDVDVATGTLAKQPDMPDLAAWASAAGLPAPAALSWPAARKSDDGTLLVVAATGATTDRRGGYQEPQTGDRDWVFAVDGATRKPLATLWHGRGAATVIAISEHHVATGGPVRVFARDALTKQLVAGESLHSLAALAWAPGGDLLAAIGETKTIVVWRTGAWGAPAARWESGGDYHSAIAFHPTRPLLAVCNQDGHLRIYGVAAAQLAKPPLLLDREVGGAASAIAFTPDGSGVLVAAGHPANQVLRFDVTAKP
jgi:WD40 repeat protein